MLNFFRKYQKGFFIVVTFFIVVSFVFFGTYNAVTGQDSVPDREIGHLVDGSVLKEQKLHGLLRLLQNGVEEGGRSFNLLSDSMVHKDLILSGLGLILAEHHFDELKGDLEMRWKRAKNYAPYVHPYAPSINAKNVWAQFSPKMIALLEDLKNAPQEFSKAQLPLLFELYKAQAEFPAPMLLQMLYYQQREGVRPDPGLPQANVALFGFESVTDWFGEKFVEEIGKLILNGACIAREEGYKVSKEEAVSDLFSNVYHGLKAYSKEQNLSSEEAQKFFSGQVRSIGLDEEHAAALWREVLYFKRLFEEVGNAVFVDNLSLNQFKNFAKPSSHVCRYSLPHELQFENFREMLKFQAYLEIVAEDNLLNLPTQLHHAEEILDDHPELVYKEFEVEMASITKADAAARVSLKETWDWEGENFSVLQKEFPELGAAQVAEIEKRMEVLDRLDERTRFKIDQFARLAIVGADPKRIDEALSRASLQKQTLKVAPEKEGAPLSGDHFLALLEIEDPSLAHYSADGETFYHIKVLRKGKGWNVLSFEEADGRAIADQLLDNLLQTAASSLKLKEPFDESTVAEKIYPDLLKAIAAQAKIENRDDYAKHRFDGHLNLMRTLAIQDPTAFEQAQKGKWALHMQEDQIALSEMPLTIGEISPLKEGQFYKLLKVDESGATDSDIASMKEILKRDAEQELMRKVLKRL